MQEQKGKSEKEFPNFCRAGHRGWEMQSVIFVVLESVGFAGIEIRIYGPSAPKHLINRRTSN